MSHDFPTNEGREIVSIVWYPYRPDRHEVVYSNGDFARLPGTLEVAAVLAEALRLDLVTTSDGTVRRERNG